MNAAAVLISAGTGFLSRNRMFEERAERIAEFRRRQPIAELKRKAVKAVERANLWTVEELDLAHAEATELAAYFEANMK